MQLDFQQLLRRLERIIEDLKYVLEALHETSDHLFKKILKREAADITMDEHQKGAFFTMTTLCRSTAT